MLVSKSKSKYLKEMFKEEIRKNFIQVANNQNKKLNIQKL